MSARVEVTGPDEVSVYVKGVRADLSPAEALELSGQLANAAAQARRKALGDAIHARHARNENQEVPI